MLKFASSSQNIEKKIILSKKRGEITRFDGTYITFHDLHNIQKALPFCILYGKSWFEIRDFSANLPPKLKLLYGVNLRISPN